MKQATTRKRAVMGTLHLAKRLREGALIILCSLAIYLTIALLTYHQADTGWSHSGMLGEPQNLAGRAGAWLSDVLLSLFGYVAYLFPAGFILGGVWVYQDAPLSTDEPNPLLWSMRCLGLLAAVTAFCGLMAIHLTTVGQTIPMNAGGLLGVMTKNALVNYLNPVGTTLILFASGLVGVTLCTGFSWLTFFEVVGHYSLRGLRGGRAFLIAQLQRALTRAPRVKWPTWQDFPKVGTALAVVRPEEDCRLEDNPLPPLNARDFPSASSARPTRKRERKTLKDPQVFRAISQDLEIPALDLLESSSTSKPLGYSTSELQHLSHLVETRLLEFGIEVKVVGAHPGPVITRFELDLAAGIKVSKITGLAKDLARSLSVVSVRVVEVIPGKSVVGLEIPNTHRELVRLKEILEDDLYREAASPLSMALGKDISGRPVIVDLARMPHLLVAGTTGSGKSVGLNAMLLSILYKATPDMVRLILIDPKMLELAVYNHIPHLLTPVVTDMKDAANALRWCVAEMEQRYQLMATLGVRNITGYNQKIEQARASGDPLLNPFWEQMREEKPSPLAPLPLIVVVVDEFADMMMVVGKKVEELIARIAQKARAAGIHLILATQRPSVDVITGLIKANIPTRIAFQVSSRIDSRTILDQSGAEQLLGHGDMLYLPPGVGVPYRIHGAFVSDEEVHQVTHAWRQSARPDYVESVVQSSGGAPGMTTLDEDVDELYDQALAIVTESRKASISLVQRRLKIGYNRAARLIELMEAEGVVSSMQSNGTREVLAAPPPVIIEES